MCGTKLSLSTGSMLTAETSQHEVLTLAGTRIKHKVLCNMVVD